MTIQNPFAGREKGMKTARLLMLCAVLGYSAAYAEPDTAAVAGHRTAEHRAQTVLHFDYELALTQATGKKHSGLRKLFWFTGTAVCKGCVWEEHSQVLLSMLSLWGDEAFSRELAAEPAPLQRQVVAALDVASPKAPVRIAFPKTYALRAHAR